jgi:two-component system, LytTR family, response regulator
VINCLVIDDEPLALDLLENFISKVPYLKLVGRFEEPLMALPLIENGKADLLFLDIKMPDITGIEFFKSLHHKPEVIFTSAYTEFAIDGFDLKAVDYLVKPISFELFIRGLNRVKDYIEYKANKGGRNRDYFFINASHKVHKIFYSDIVYLEGFKDYTKMFLAGSTSPLVVLHNLKYFEDLLQENQFIRIHRSYIVPIRMITTISRKAVTIGNMSLPVSDNYREKLFAIIS